MRSQDEMFDKQHVLLRKLGDCMKSFATIRRMRDANSEFYDTMQHALERDVWDIERQLDKIYNETWVRMRKQSKKKVPDFLKETI